MIGKTNATTGTNVQKASGTFRTSGSFTINCGFKPDYVTFETYDNGDRKNYSGSADLKKTADFGLWVDNGTVFVMNMMVSATQNGFYCRTQGFDYTARMTSANGISVRYEAVKYTE